MMMAHGLGWAEYGMAWCRVGLGVIEHMVFRWNRYKEMVIVLLMSRLTL